jgi:ubiquitin C-terminal hydrolase
LKTEVEIGVFWCILNELLHYCFGRIESAVGKFFNPLDIDDFMCQFCGNRSTALAMYYIDSLPRILVVHANRNTGGPGKSQNAVRIQQELLVKAFRMPLSTASIPRFRLPFNEIFTSAWKNAEPQQPDCIDPNTYHIAAIVSHLGQTSTSGHYICDVHDVANDRWLTYDDEKVSQCPAMPDRDDAAYLVVYVNACVLSDLCAAMVSAARKGELAAVQKEISELRSQGDTLQVLQERTR